MQSSEVTARIRELTEIAKTMSADESMSNRAKSDAYLELSEYLFSYGVYKSAAYNFEMAFKSRRDYVYDSLNAKICIMTGLCQIRIGSLIQAERFFGYGLAAAKQSESTDYECICCANMALIYLLQGHVEEAITWGNNALTEAKGYYDHKSQEYLDIVRGLLSVLIQSGHYKDATALITASQFSVIEGSLLSAGCFLAQGDYDKARALLVIAHGQYHSEMRIKEARTPSVTTLTNLSGGVLGTFMEEEGDEEPSPMRDQFADNSMQLMMTADMYEKEVFGEEIFSKWDFGKQKEYSCREQVMPALVNYNLSVLCGLKGDFEKQKHHIDEAVEIMRQMLRRLESETASAIVLQATEGVIKESVLPAVDTLISSYLAYSHIQTARSEDLFLHGPLMSSLKVQSGATVETDHRKTDEHVFLQYVLEELNSSIASWSEDFQLKTMLHIINNNLATKEKRRQEERAANAAEGFGDGSMVKLKNMKSKLKNLSKKSKASAMELGEDKVKATNAIAIEKAQREKDENDRKAEMEEKTLEETMDCFNADMQLANISVASMLHVANFDVSKNEDMFSVENGLMTDNYKSVEQAAIIKNAEEKQKSKSKKTTPNLHSSSSAISTHGSVKQEMMPTCRPSHVEGVTEADATISAALALCDGLGYGAMCMSGVPDWEEGDAKTDRRAEIGSKLLKNHHVTLMETKKKLQTLESTIAPKKNETNDGNAKEKGNQGTLLALYSALAVMSSTLGVKKDAGLYINRFVNFAEKIGHPHYQALGCRMSLDFEEWVQSSATTYFTAKPMTRLKKLQAVLLNIKRFLGFASQCKDIDPELYFDAYKRLVNCYCDISSLPKEKGEDGEDDEEDNMANLKLLQTNLTMLSPQDIDDCEVADVDWLREYAAVRARQCQMEMSAELKTTLATSQQYLENVGIA